MLSDQVDAGSSQKTRQKIENWSSRPDWVRSTSTPVAPDGPPPSRRQSHPFIPEMIVPAELSRSDFRFFWHSRVRYSEIDGQAVVYNAHYLTYYDTAIFEYYRAIGYSQFDEAKALGEDWHVVRALVEYRAPMRYDLEFEVGVRLARIGRSSLAYALAVFPKDDNQILATGEVVQVYTDQRTHKSTSIPPRIRGLFLAFEQPLAG